VRGAQPAAVKAYVLRAEQSVLTYGDHSALGYEDPQAMSARAEREQARAGGPIRWPTSASRPGALAHSTTLPRAWVARPLPRTLNVIELDAGGDVRVDAYAGGTFDRPPPHDDLPHIESRSTTILRNDRTP